MSTSTQSARQASRWPVWSIAVFLLILVVGLFYVKWHPYFLKSFVAASHHSIGASLVSGRSAAAPPASWQAALNYGIVYFKDIWTALVVGLLVGSGIQALLPRDWLLRVLGSAGLKSRSLAALAAVPSMM